MTRTFSDLLAWHQAGVERHGNNVETTRPPTPAARLDLSARYDELHRALSPPARDKQAVGIAVGELLHAFQPRLTEKQAKDTLTKYIEVLADRPAWAVQRACWAIARGEVEGVSLDFPPAAPRIREVVNKILEPFFVEAAQVREVLHAQVRRTPNPAERELMQKRFAELLAELQAKNAVEDDRRAKAAERLGREADKQPTLEEQIDDWNVWP
jgi:hypothetical protein